MSDIAIRQATVADLRAINDIYNHYVLHCTCTYQTEPETDADRRAWFERHGPEHPIVVAQGGGEVLGWGSLSPFHAREAYRQTVEVSVYVRHDTHGRGVGSALLKHLVARAKECGRHAIIGIIDAGQAASLALHAKHGFVEMGRLHEVGFKFGRWRDVIYVQRMLG